MGKVSNISDFICVCKGTTLVTLTMAAVAGKG